jgi:thiol:disulfide interchange protein DsbA
MRAYLLSLLLLLAAPLAHAQALPGLTEGKEYRYIAAGAPYRATPGKTEVAEIFAYWCPHCAHFDPLLQAWKRKLPASAYLVTLPMVSGPDDAFGRAFFAAEASGNLAVLHPQLFRAVHETGSLPRQPSLAQINAFVAKLPDIKQAAYEAALANDDGLRAKMAKAYQFALRSDIPGTPSLVIDGRYLVLGNSYEELLANASKILATLAQPPAAKPRS